MMQRIAVVLLVCLLALLVGGTGQQGSTRWFGTLTVVQQTLTTTAAPIAPGLGTIRMEIKAAAGNTQPVRIGSSVTQPTTSLGYPLAAGQSVQIDMTNALVYGIAESGSQVVDVLVWRR